jgi:hypothetical protein
MSVANARDATELSPLIDAILPIAGPRGEPRRPRLRPKIMHADEGYDYPVLRRAMRVWGISSGDARRAIDSSERLRRHRRAFERRFAWLHGSRRLGVR